MRRCRRSDCVQSRTSALGAGAQRTHQELTAVTAVRRGLPGRPASRVEQRCIATGVDGGIGGGGAHVHARRAVELHGPVASRWTAGVDDEEQHPAQAHHVVLAEGSVGGVRHGAGDEDAGQPLVVGQAAVGQLHVAHALRTSAPASCQGTTAQGFGGRAHLRGSWFL